MVANRQTNRSLSVSIVARSRETIDGLQRYLGRADVASHAALSLDGLKSVAREATAIILFPDEFEAKEVEESVLSLRAARPRVLLVVVTALPQQLDALLRPDARSSQPIVLPKPAFGWTILDAVRDQAESP